MLIGIHVIFDEKYTVGIVKNSNIFGVKLKYELSLFCFFQMNHRCVRSYIQLIFRISAGTLKSLRAAICKCLKFFQNQSFYYHFLDLIDIYPARANTIFLLPSSPLSLSSSSSELEYSEQDLILASIKRFNSTSRLDIVFFYSLLYCNEYKL